MQMHGKSALPKALFAADFAVLLIMTYWQAGRQRVPHILVCS